MRPDPTRGQPTGSRQPTGTLAVPRHPHSLRLATGAAALAVTLAGCRVDVASEIDITDTGTGTLAVTVQVDTETAATLTALGLSLRPAAVAGWESEESTSDDAHEVVVSTSFATPEELTARVDELSLGLDGEDPAVLTDVTLVVADDGAATFDGMAGLRLPSSAGADAAGWPTAEELQALAGDVTASLAVTFPGTVEESNATTVDERTATWDLAVGSLQPVTAASAPPSLWQQGWLRWAAGAALLVLLLVTVVVARRSRRRRVEAPLGRVDRMRLDR